MKWKTTTEGEKLFAFINTQLRNVARRDSIDPWRDVGELLSVTSRGEELSSFFQFVSVLHVQAKAMAIVKGLHKENKLLGVEPGLKDICSRLSEEFSFCVNKELTTEFAKQVGRSLEKVYEYQQTIPQRFKTLLFPGNASCYICGKTISIANGTGDLDHIWPRSLGGDTSRENLLPACLPCNRSKDQLPTWAWGLVQSTFLGASDTEKRHAEKIKKIPGPTKISIYLRRLFLEAEAESLTLKEAATRLGPSSGVVGQPSHFKACDFFDLSPILSN